MMAELFGLTISEGAIANSFRRLQSGLDLACAATRDKLLGVRAITSDKTTTLIDGMTHWQ